MGWLDPRPSRSAEAVSRRSRPLAADAHGPLTVDGHGLVQRDEVPALAQRFHFGTGKRWEGSVGLSTRLLFLMAAEWTIVRARPRGSWVSGQYRWSRLETWATELPAAPSPEAGRRALIAGWLASFGPGTERDLAWWSGLPLGQLRAALGSLDVATVRLDEGAGVALATDLEPTKPAAPTATLLPGLDPSPMGWKLRDWFLGPHGEALFDTTGNVGPTVWWDGRIVGAWSQRPDGSVSTCCSRTPGARHRMPSKPRPHR